MLFHVTSCYFNMIITLKLKMLNNVGIVKQIVKQNKRINFEIMLILKKNLLHSVFFSMFAELV